MQGLNPDRKSLCGYSIKGSPYAGCLFIDALSYLTVEIQN